VQLPMQQHQENKGGGTIAFIRSIISSSMVIGKLSFSLFWSLLLQAQITTTSN
jgi:hypothetical protein